MHNRLIFLYHRVRAQPNGVAPGGWPFGVEPGPRAGG
jgi:hypothetical protein